MFEWLRRKSSVHAWWQCYPVRGSRLPRAPGPRDCTDPRFIVGAAVRLRGRPAKIRRVLRVEWHWIRREYSYIVETSALNFAPYWFAAQLEGVEESGRVD